MPRAQRASCKPILQFDRVAARRHRAGACLRPVRLRDRRPVLRRHNLQQRACLQHLQVMLRLRRVGRHVLLECNRKRLQHLHRLRGILQRHQKMPGVRHGRRGVLPAGQRVPGAGQPEHYMQHNRNPDLLQLRRAEPGVLRRIGRKLQRALQVQFNRSLRSLRH